MKRINRLASSFLTILCFTISAFTFNDASHIKGEVTDIDGNTYQTVKINDLEWMSENLNVNHFQNGDEIPEIKSLEEWKRANQDKQPAQCYYDFDSKNEATHGKIYNEFAVTDERGIAPSGYHPSTSEDWQNLLSLFKPYRGSDRSFKGGKEIRTANGWNGKALGNNKYGLNIMPSGYIQVEPPAFGGGNGKGACFYGGEMYESSGKFDIIVFDASIKATNIFSNQSNQGFSIRCVKD